jgi:hypothetical protein
MRYSLIFGGILIMAVLIAGCSDQSGSTTTTVPVTAAIQPKFVAGDIIAKTPASTDTFWLIVKYDTKTDKYERAMVFKTLQQTWFRRDNKTETVDRTLAEKLYPAKIFHTDSIASIPINTPAPTTVTVTTTTSGPGPVISSITPNYGTIGTLVSISNIAGRNFQSGATVKLIDALGFQIAATNVLATDSKITCIFDLDGASAGKGDVVVKNPDGQSSTLTDGFTINEPGPVITTIDPSEGTVGGQPLTLLITGSNFKVPAKVLFIRGSAEIEAGNVVVNSAKEITCVLTIPQGTAPGLWSITVRNVADKQNGTATNKFTINNAS